MKEELGSKVSMKLSGRELNIIMSWIFTDFKPDNEHPVDTHILKKFKNALIKTAYYDDWENEFIKYLEGKTSTQEEFDNKEHQKEIDKIRDNTGVFFCQECNVRTNEKTYTTKCVVCGTSLLRG